MSRDIPPITESVGALKQRLQHEHHGRKHPRLQLLYLLASGQAHTRQEVSHLLGLRRNTIGRWLATYQTGGLAALLDIYVPAGQAPLARPLRACQPRAGAPPATRRRLLQGSAAVARPDAWRTGQVQDVVQPGAQTLPHQTQSTAPQPHKQKPEAVAAFQATCADQLRAVIPSDNTRPVQVFSQDESRFGRLTVRRRRLRARGVQPIGTIQHVFQWFYVYGAVAPASGASFFLELPYRTSQMFQLCLDELAQAFSESVNVLVLDKRGGHTAKRLMVPENVRLVLLPPASPELNPIERMWRDLQDDLAWLQFPDVATQQAYVADLLRAYNAPILDELPIPGRRYSCTICLRSAVHAHDSIGASVASSISGVVGTYST